MRFTRWDQTVDSSTTTSLLQELAHWHIGEIHDITTKEYLSRHLSEGDFPGLCDVPLPYEKLSVSDCLHARQVIAFFQKRSDIDFHVDRTAVARKGFSQSEYRCLATNDIFEKLRRGDFQFTPAVEAVFHGAQRKIADILGDVPSIESLHLRFGPGATTNVKKQNASPRVKLGARLSCSEDLLPDLKKVLEEMPAWIPFTGDSDTALVPVDVVPGKLCFVPKTAKTDRAIVVEPVLNTMCQAGIGDFLANRLRRSGIDIRDQTRNQSLAREGSITGALATLDLSSASDTIARELVAHLLPVDWYLFLSGFRTSRITTDAGCVHLQMFSSMGNGFTFPLETLIFYGIAFAATTPEMRGSVSVYGDDIIVPVQDYRLTCEALNAAGFVVNQNKSFSSGPFRESCGKDYLSGIDIRPSYVKGPLAGSDVFALHNFYARALMPDPLRIVLGWIDESLQIFGPDGYGDGHLLGDYCPRPHRREHGWGGYTFDTYSYKGRKLMRPVPGDYVYPIYATYVSEDRSRGPEGRTSLKSHALQLRPVIGHSYRKGALCSSLPGVSGCRRMTIYTLNP